MSKIVIPLTSHGRLEGAYTWIGRQLGNMGHKVSFPMATSDPTAWGDFDYQIYVDHGEDCFDVPPTFVSHPSLCWQSDTHMTRESYLYRLNQSRQYDHVFAAQLDAVKQFKVDGIERTQWMPHTVEHNLWCPPLKHHGPDGSWSYMNLPPDIEAMDSLTVEKVPIYDFCFVGHVDNKLGQERLECLHNLFGAFDNWAWEAGKFFEEAVTIFHKSKIVFNRSIYHDLNMRTFEALGTRSFLLTDRQQGMEELGLRDGEHCAIYENTGEAIEKMAYWLDPARDKQRKDIARNGWEWVLNNHTYWHRARVMCKALGLDTNP